jgi:hypothetical protein
MQAVSMQEHLVSLPYVFMQEHLVITVTPDGPAQAQPTVRPGVLA